MSNTQEIYSKDVIYRSPRPPICLPHNPKISMIPFLFTKFSSISNSPALIDAQSAQTLTFSNLKTHVSRLSRALLNLNISKHDVVLILSPNSIHFPIAFFAVVAVGAVATTANPLYTKAELSKQIKDSNPKLIITVHQLYDRIKHFNLPCVLLNHNNPRTSSDPMVHSYSELIQSPATTSLPTVMQSDAAAILYSSGTTGASKGSVLTHKNFMASALMMTSDQKVSGNVFLCFLPMFHIFGLSAAVYAQLQRGNTVVVMGRYEMNTMLRAIEQYKVTHLFVVPPVAVELIKKQETVKEYNVSTLREIMSGAAPLGKDMIEACSKIFPQAVVCQAYGMTEATGVISLENRRICSAHPGSVGPLAPSVEAQIVDSETMQPLSPFKTGEIWIKGPLVMKGYWNNHKATMETIDKQDWLHTGDVGYFDDEGRLYIVDRVKELIKYKGFQVAPAELEELLLTHPEIVDAAVIGLGDAEAGEIPIAYVVRSSNSSLTTQQVGQFIAEQVAPFKRLRRVIFTKQIPRSTTGKILRKELRQKVVAKL
ncbi:probable CoA ligase CCL7 [Salvia miltiorrhiza]|uniref:probable CoA ligase CCL7 n=1 Tax=Salvia miltiorrhiza TaxID=226208 RepID=UPI0025ABD5D1|nr:probable CoA ligase CCL7 [Salvia miltiorrhiza]